MSNDNELQHEEDVVAFQCEGDGGQEELDGQRSDRTLDHRRHCRDRDAGEFSGGLSNSEDQSSWRQRSQMEDPVLAELRKINFSFRSLSDRVGALESERDAAPTPKRRRATEMRSWASRMDLEDAAAEPDDLSDDENVEREHSLNNTIALSENNAALITSSFGSTISNGERRRVRSAFPVPEVEATRCPKLDPIFKTKSVKAETKAADAELARIQAFVHDPVGPLVQLLQGLDGEDETESQITVPEAKAAVTDAIKLLGNASAQISTLRRKKILTTVNPDIQDLAEQNIFQEAAPNLFGDDFEEKMKKRAKSLKFLKKSSETPQATSKFFRGGRPTAPQRGGGPSNRGGRRAWTKKPSQKK